MSKTVLVIGGSKGIGQSIVEKFIQSGYKVGFSYNSTVPEYHKKYAADTVFTGPCDVRDEEQIKAFLKDFKEFSANQIDIFVYNSGITIDNLTVSTTTDDYDKVMDTNLRGAWIFLREVGHLMFFRRRGRMFFISSVSASRGGRGQLSYAASKAGLEALVRVGAQEFSRVGVLVNGIAPGIIETDMTKNVMDYLKGNQKNDALFDRIAMRRVGQPLEVANLIHALSQDEITYMTGQTIHIDGGYML
ncbi:MAG: SDR family oxidoreductase [Candidatus Cloacimonetes bacterium]|nr:SDR family oxidoreductase [Candidatus Cloacimonadota bacterium]